MPNLIAKVTGLHKSYAAKPNPIQVLRDLNLEIQKGEFLIVFGQSGSGKSTLLNLIMGLEKPTAGKVELLGLNVAATSEEELSELRKHKIGIVYQQPYWIKSLNLVENVAFPLLLHGYSVEDSQKEALKKLAEVGMIEWANFQPTELSSGQQQKASLARSLVTNPELIIADEPTGNLDYHSGQSLTEYLRDLTNTGRTVIMVTHNLDNLDYAERLVQIFDGKIINDTQITKENLAKLKKSLATEARSQSLTYDMSKQAKGKLKLSYRAQIEDMLEKKSILARVKEFFSNVIKSLVTVVMATTALSFRAALGLLSMNFLPDKVNKLAKKLNNVYLDIMYKLQGGKSDSISYASIFELSFKNLFTRKNRAFVTIGGVALSIAFTTFLVSLGYGLENVVVSQAAQLDQLKQIDVYPSIGESISLNEQTLATIKELNNVESVYPVIGLAGNVNYESSNTDVVVYGVQSDYLKTAEANLVAGTHFASNKQVASGKATSESFVSGNNSELRMTLPQEIEKKLVVNQAFLQLLNLQPNEGVGKSLSISFIGVGFNNEEDAEVKSNAENYEIAGVIDTTDVPVVYAPLSDIKTMGDVNYSQLRLITKDEKSVSDIRQQLHGIGFRTTSVQDTVMQIEGFFQNARIVFAAIGFVAMAVASLGMFNTLTVSLLERTREVGLMKAIGIKSDEVRRLFLSESVVMGVAGGIIGVLMGIILGYLVSLIFYVFASSSGYSYTNLTYLPFYTGLLIVVVTGLTGIATGFYPAQRATKISALDALRYE